MLREQHARVLPWAASDVISGCKTSTFVSIVDVSIRRVPVAVSKLDHLVAVLNFNLIKCLLLHPCANRASQSKVKTAYCVVEFCQYCLKTSVGQRQCSNLTCCCCRCCATKSCIVQQESDNVPGSCGVPASRHRQGLPASCYRNRRKCAIRNTAQLHQWGRFPDR